MIEYKNRWSCTNNSYKKLLTGTVSLLAPAANHAWYKLIFYWLHEMAACCYFEVDLRNLLYQYSLSRLTDGTPHSSCDLIYFTLLLPFTWTNYSKSNSLSPFCLFGQKLSKSNSSSLFLSDKNILSPTPISAKFSKTTSFFVLAANSF